MRMLQCDCGAIIRGETDDEVMENGMKHSKEVHPDLKLTPELLGQLRARIVDG